MMGWLKAQTFEDNITAQDRFKIYLWEEFGIPLTTKPSSINLNFPEYKISLDVVHSDDNKQTTINGEMKIIGWKESRGEYHNNTDYLNLDVNIKRLIDKYIIDKSEENKRQIKAAQSGNVGSSQKVKSTSFKMIPKKR